MLANLLNLSSTYYSIFENILMIAYILMIEIH